jgi:cell division protein FtsB
LIRAPSAQGVAFRDQRGVPPRGVTKVERLNRVRQTQASPFVITPDWGRRVPPSPTPEIENPRPVNPRLEARHRDRHEARREKQEETLITTPTLPAGQPRMRGVNVLLTILAIVGSLHVIVMMGIELNRMVATQQEITRLTLETTTLEAEVAGLQSVLDNGDNPLYREQLARKAGFAYPDEVRFLSVPNPQPDQP